MTSGNVPPSGKGWSVRPEERIPGSGWSPRPRKPFRREVLNGPSASRNTIHAARPAHALSAAGCGRSGPGLTAGLPRRLRLPWGRMGGQRISGLSGLFDGRLPINRKERYYTGTVLPMIVACDGFKHLNRFLELCGAPSKVAVEADPASCNIEFFTEYSLKESLRGGAEKRFSDPAGKDTPDLVIYIESDTSLLLSVEAKLFERASADILQGQLRKQADLLCIMSEGLGTRPLVRQVALLPAKLGVSGPIGDVPVLTWEQVACAFRDVAPVYWTAVLDEALSRYEELVSRGAKKNYNARIAGQRICMRYNKGDNPYVWMVREGGLHGPEIQEDLETGRWMKRKYLVSHQPPPKKDNWFPIADFVEKVDSYHKIA